MLLAGEWVKVFRSYVLTLREVLAVKHVAGADDFLVHVAVETTDSRRRGLAATLLRYRRSLPSCPSPCPKSGAF
jgi:hypothetical protein